MKQKQETNHIQEYIRNEIGIDHFYQREKKTILIRVDEETLGILEDMDQPSSVSDNRSRLGGPGSHGGQNSKRSIRSIVNTETDLDSVRKAGAEINIIALTGRNSKQVNKITIDGGESGHFNNGET